MQWILTKEFHLCDNSAGEFNKIPENEILQKTDNLFKLIKVFDFVYTKSDFKEDFGFVCEVTDDHFVVTFSKMNKRVTFRFEEDKKLRLIKEIWKPTNEKTYRKIWSSKER